MEIGGKVGGGGGADRLKLETIAHLIRGVGLRKEGQIKEGGGLGLVHFKKKYFFQMHKAT